jgi:hypothetical protein
MRGVEHQLAAHADRSPEVFVRELRLRAGEFLAGLRARHAAEDILTDWTTGQDRTPIGGTEGWEVRLVARLKIVKKEGKENCNCGLSKQADADVHLVMVDRLADDESESISAELTPRVRADGHHTTWLPRQLLPYQGKLVRLTGWVMLDTAHVHHSHLLRGEHPVGPVNRSSDWEVHPVTTFEVCTSTIARCRAGVGWKAVD